MRCASLRSPVHEPGGRLTSRRGWASCGAVVVTDQRSARWLALAGVIVLGAGACEDGPTEAELEGHLVSVPSGWEAERAGHGPVQELALRDQTNTVVCRLIVIHDGRTFGETDRAAFVASGRDTYGSRDVRDAEVATASGPLVGSAFTATRLDASWAVRALAGDPELQIVAAGRGTELVAAIVGTHTGDGDRATKREACLRAVGSLR